MGMMLPDELIWIMEKVGFDWPDLDEDEIQRLGTILGTFRDDLETKIQTVDQKVSLELHDAMRGQAGPAYVTAWNTTRDQNLQKLLDLLQPAPAACDIAAAVVVALKIKCVVEMTAFLGKILTAMAAFPVGAGAAALLIIGQKKAMEFAVNVAMEEAMEAVMPMLITPLEDELPAVMDAILSAPLTEAAVGNPDEFYADLQALEQAEADMRGHAADVNTLTANLMADIGGLRLTGS